MVVQHLRLVTMQEVAKRYGVHPKTVALWIAGRRVPAYKIGPRAVRLDLDEVEQVLVRPMGRPPEDGEAA